MTNPSTITSRQPVAQPITPRRSVPLDVPEPQAAAAAKPPSQPALYESRANERMALHSQSIKVEAALADAKIVRDRAIARKAVDGSTEVRAAADAAIGTVVRIEAELDGVRSALAALDAQREANAAASEKNRETARVKAAARLAEEMVALANVADAALRSFTAAFMAVNDKARILHQTTPPPYNEAVFMGGNGLTCELIAKAARNQLGQSGLLPRDVFPSAVLADMATAIAHFTRPLIEGAAILQVVPVDWD